MVVVCQMLAHRQLLNTCRSTAAHALQLPMCAFMCDCCIGSMYWHGSMNSSFFVATSLRLIVSSYFELCWRYKNIRTLFFFFNAIIDCWFVQERGVEMVLAQHILWHFFFKQGGEITADKTQFAGICFARLWHLFSLISVPVFQVGSHNSHFLKIY